MAIRSLIILFLLMPVCAVAAQIQVLSHIYKYNRAERIAIYVYSYIKVLDDGSVEIGFDSRKPASEQPYTPVTITGEQAFNFRKIAELAEDAYILVGRNNEGGFSPAIVAEPHTALHFVLPKSGDLKIKAAEATLYFVDLHKKADAGEPVQLVLRNKDMSLLGSPRRELVLSSKKFVKAGIPLGNKIHPIEDPNRPTRETGAVRVLKGPHGMAFIITEQDWRQLERRLSGTVRVIPLPQTAVRVPRSTVQFNLWCTHRLSPTALGGDINQGLSLIDDEDKTLSSIMPFEINVPEQASLTTLESAIIAEIGRHTNGPFGMDLQSFSESVQALLTDQIPPREKEKHWYDWFWGFLRACTWH